MDKLFKGQHIIPSYETEDAMLVFGDTFQVLDKMKSQSIDLIFADPPYFLSNGGFTCSGGKQVSVNKGDWDAADGWSAKHRFNRRWLHRCHRILKQMAVFGLVVRCIIFFLLAWLWSKKGLRLSIILLGKRLTRRRTWLVVVLLIRQKRLFGLN